MKFLVTFCVLGLFSQLPAFQAETNVGRENSGRNKRSTGDSSYFFYQEPEYPRDCKEVYDQCEGSPSESGVYLIKPDGANEPFQVYCNNSIDGGGWTVFQRRVDGSVEFYRDWDDYRDGFGFLNKEFWLGNDKLSLLTNQKDYMLRIDLNNVNGDPYFAKYDLFRISDEETKYRLVGLGEYDSSSTTAYDRMAYHRNQSFSTFNRDNDPRSDYHLAQFCHGAWWHGARCHYGGSNLNGLYTAGSTGYKSIYWIGLPGSGNNIKYAEMKIRPVLYIDRKQQL